MKKLMLALIVLGMAGLGFSQKTNRETKTIELDNVLVSSEMEKVMVSPANMEYLSVVQVDAKSKRVLGLENHVALFDLKNESYFTGAPQIYNIRFKQHDGWILATYDDKGNILQTYERFEDIQFPDQVKRTIYSEFPDWNIEGNIYRVKYYRGKDAEKIFKVVLRKESEQIKVKCDHKGNIL